MSRLLVLGNAGMDISLPVPRLPQPGESLVGGARTGAPGGKGLNQAVVAARTGLAPVHFHAPVGEDAEADTIATALAAEDFAGLELQRLPGPTDLSILLVLPDAENCVVGAGGCAAALPPADAARSAGTVQPGEWLLLQGNLTGRATAAALQAVRGRAMLNTAPLLWDARPLLARCDIVVANAVEARQITGLDGNAAATALLAAGARHAIVTLGAEGCIVAGPVGVTHHPAPVVQPVDTTGAGDTFCGVLAAMLAAGCDLTPAVAAAQQAAAITVRRHGAFAALPTAAELRALTPQR
jgi:ribokinase